MKSKVLAVNADASFLRSIRRNFVKIDPELVIDASRSVRTAQKKLEKTHYDCILYSVAQNSPPSRTEIEQLRVGDSVTPVVLLVRQCSDLDFEVGIAAGADDCFIVDDHESSWIRLRHLLRRVIKLHERDEETARQKALIETLASFDEEIAHLRADEIIGKALDFIHHRLGVFHVSITIPRKENNDFLVSDLRTGLEGIFKAKSIRPEETVVSQVVERQESLYRPDLVKEKKKYELDKILISDGIRSDFILPLYSGGRCMGAMACASRERDGFPDRLRHVLTLLAPRLAQSLRNAQLFAALGESEERFRAIFENATIGIYRTTPSGEILLANHTLVEMLGFDSFSELSKRNLEENGFEPDYPREEFRRRIESDGSIIGLESAWKRSDGSIIYVRESARAVVSDSGKVIYYEGTVEDISDRKQLEMSLRREAEIHADVAELTRELLGVNTQAEIAEIILSHARKLTNSPYGFAGYMDSETGYIVSPTMAADIQRGDCSVPTKDNVFRDPGGLIGWVLKNKRSVVTNDLKKDKRAGGLPAGHVKINRFLAAPAIIANESVGLIGLANADKDYRDSDLALVERLALIYAQAILRIRAEDELRQERQMFMRGPVVVFKWGADRGWPVEYVSPNVEHCGFRAEDFADRKLRYIDIVHPEDRKRIEQVTGDNADKGVDSFEREYRVVRPDGGICWVRDTTTAIRNPEGQLSHYLGYVFDDTEHKLAEQAVQESEEKYRRLFESEQDAILLIEADGKGFRDANPAACRMYGYSREEFTQLSATAISAEVEESLDSLKRAQSDGEFFVPKRNHVRKDGTLFPVEASLGMVTVKGETLISAIVRDISERVRAEEALRESRDRLERQAELLAATNRELESFAHTVSHDLQAPLRRISGWIKLLQEEQQKQPESPLDEYLLMIDNNSKEMRRLVNALLEFSRTSRLEIESVNIDLSKMAREIFNTLKGDAPSRQVSITIKEGVRGKGDPGLVKQVLDNLIRNA